MPTVLAQERFGRNVRSERERHGWSQEALGQRADLHLSEVSRLERGEREPRLGTMTKLAKALGVDLATLIRGI